jgi:sporulation protein YlmC with PRC-barrel domain
MKLKELIDKDVYVSDEKIGKVKDAVLDTDGWRVTHFEIELTKEAAKSILGAITAIRNMLAVSALAKGMACCTDKGLEIKVSKAQLHIYLRPIQ